MYHTLTVEDALEEFKSNPKTGLTSAEALNRLAIHGPNKLPAKKEPPTILKFIDQFRDFLVIILLVAVAISFAVGEVVDALAILAIVLLNAIIGFVQELKAEETLESLKEKDVAYALVLRDNEVEKVPVTDIVIGDILILEEGSKVAADARIMEDFTLKVDESILTGESVASDKNEKPLKDPNLTLGDRLNMVYKDTQVVTGRGKALVVQTGKNTEIGKIANFLQKEQDDATPLTLELQKVGKMLTTLILLIAMIVFVLSLARKEPFIESLLTAISLSVAAIPEGLPAIVTIVLSLGVKRLAQQRTLVKKLPAVETLGAIHIIATDKTGTITQNKMNVVSITPYKKEMVKVDGVGFEPIGAFFDLKEKLIDPLKSPLLREVLIAGVLANNASLSTENGKPEILGDTTEGALLVAAQRAKLTLSEINTRFERIYEVPFTSDRKRMSVIVKEKDTREYFLISKGAPETLIEYCNMTKTEKEAVRKNLLTEARNGYRTLGIGKRKLTNTEVKRALDHDEVKEDALTYLGLVSMQDPLRKEVAETIQKAKNAGIRTIMITGDHKETAGAIARLAGIAEENHVVLTDTEINHLSVPEIRDRIDHGVSVFARISPLNKLKIIQAIKHSPHTQVAVTGDGVNDAPALKAAHIGIAMGKSGTDLTREVADIIITDDNYVTIIEAIREGRVIFSNLVKFIRYLISCNISEVFLVAGATFVNLPHPLFPIQLLWINLITDGFPALALGMEPAESDVMKRKPRDLRDGILNKKRWAYMILEGFIMGAIVFALFYWALGEFGESVARTMGFSALAVVQIVHAFNNRSTRRSLFSIHPFTNKPLIAAGLFSLILQTLVVQTSLGNSIFKTTPLTVWQWYFVIFAGIATFILVELKKFIRIRIFKA